MEISILTSRIKCRQVGRQRSAKGEVKVNIEIVEFYPIERNEKTSYMSGTLHVRIDNLIDLRGMFVARNNGKYYIHLPNKRAMDEKGNNVTYPVFSFIDREKTMALMALIREQAPAFIEKRLNDTANPLAWPEKKQQQNKPYEAKKQPHEALHISKQSSPNVSPIMQKKPEPAKSYTTIKPNMQWSDPPPRKSIEKKQYSTTRR